MSFNVNDLNITKKENTLKDARNQTTLKPVDVFFCVSLRKEGMSYGLMRVNDERMMIFG